MLYYHPHRNGFNVTNAPNKTIAAKKFAVTKEKVYCLGIAPAWGFDVATREGLIAFLSENFETGSSSEVSWVE